MLPTSNPKMFATYKVITAVRQKDGAKLISTRVVINEKLPVRWNVEVTYSQPSFFQAPMVSITEPPSTSKLIKKAAEEGYGDWYPVPEGMEEIFPIDAPGDRSKMKLTPKYPKQDTVDYLVD